jgi:hypothetical protein
MSHDVCFSNMSGYCCVANLAPGDYEEVTILTFVMVTNTIYCPHPQYLQKDLKQMKQPGCEDDLDDQQSSVAPDSGCVVYSGNLAWLTCNFCVVISKYHFFLSRINGHKLPSATMNYHL